MSVTSKVLQDRQDLPVRTELPAQRAPLVPHVQLVRREFRGRTGRRVQPAHKGTPAVLRIDPHQGKTLI